MRIVIPATIMHLAAAVAGLRLAWVHRHPARTVVDDHGKDAADHGAARRRCPAVVVSRGRAGGTESRPAERQGANHRKGGC